MQESAHFLEDASKYSMVLSQIYMYATNMWPVNFTYTRKVLFFTIVGMAVLHSVDILVFCCSYVRNVDTLAEMFQQMDLGFQVRNNMFTIDRSALFEFKESDGSKNTTIK